MEPIHLLSYTHGQLSYLVEDISLSGVIGLLTVYGILIILALEGHLMYYRESYVFLRKM